MNVLRPGLALGALFAFAPGGEKIAFAPEPGSSLSKRFEIKLDFTLDELSLVADGQDIADMMGAIEIDMTTASTVVVTDGYEALDAGRPKKLKRTFDELASLMHISFSMAMAPEGSSDEEMTFASPLEGETVLFTWNEEQEDFDITFADGEGDPELLEGLDEDMDLRALLPDSEVAAGDSWKVEIKELHGLAMPGGNLRIEPDVPDGIDEEDMEFFEELFGGGMHENFDELFDGECTCTFVGTREEKGARVAEITIELEVASTLDLSDMLLKVIGRLGEMEGEMPELSIETADLNLDFEGQGSLLWDVAAGRMHSFHVSGDAQIAFDIAMSVDMQGESHAFEGSLEMSGTYEQGAETGE